MAHTLNLTKGARNLASQVLNIPDQFKTLADLHVALTTASALNMEGKAPDPQEDPAGFMAWVAEVAPVDLNEAQRDLLKNCCKNNSSKLPINTHTLLLLTELGLTS